jgi:epoxyqueuosine reductase QueG
MLAHRSSATFQHDRETVESRYFPGGLSAQFPQFVQLTSEEAFWPRRGVHGERLIELTGMTQEEFSRRFKNSPVKRAKRRGLLRNVAVALGNWGSPEAVPVLRGRVGVEEDGWVREEIELALA